MLALTNLVGFGASAGNDPYWNNVVLLVLPDGADGATTFTDLSKSAHALTTNGGAQVDTGILILGRPTLLLDGTGDYLSKSASSTDFAFGTADFTIEWYAAKTTNAPSGFDQVITVDSNGSGTGGFLAETSTSRGFTMVIENNVRLSTAVTNINDGVARHYAIDRSGTTLRSYVNGVVLETQTNSDNIASSQPLRIGVDGSLAFEFAGNLGPIRITKGVARYNGAFTPPTEFPVG
jgi:hypothetical protein